jgi:hypothetical protein
MRQHRHGLPRSQRPCDFFQGGAVYCGKAIIVAWHSGVQHQLADVAIGSGTERSRAAGLAVFIRNKYISVQLFGSRRESLMVHETTVERVTNRVWGIFSSLDHGIAGNNNRRALLRGYIASLAERGEHNTDKLTVDGLVYLKNLTSHKKKPVKRRA